MFSRLQYQSQVINFVAGKSKIETQLRSFFFVLLNCRMDFFNKLFLTPYKELAYIRHNLIAIRSNCRGAGSLISHWNINFTSTSLDIKNSRTSKIASIQSINFLLIYLFYFNGSEILLSVSLYFFLGSGSKIIISCAKINFITYGNFLAHLNSSSRKYDEQTNSRKWIFFCSYLIRVVLMSFSSSSCFLIHLFMKTSDEIVIIWQMPFCLCMREIMKAKQGRGVK